MTRTTTSRRCRSVDFAPGSRLRIAAPSATANSFSSNNYNLELTGNSFISFTINSFTRLLTRANSGSNWTADGSHVTATGSTAKRDSITTLSAQYAFGDTSNCDGPITSAISGADSVCTDSSGATYSVTNTGGSTYSWTITGGTLVTGQSTNDITVDWGSTGMVGNVRVVETNDCTSGAPVDKPVNIHTLPTSSIAGRDGVSEFASGEIYSVTARAGYTYTWAINGGDLATGQGTDTITVNWDAQGVGNVRVTASTGCTGSADPVDLTVTIYAVMTSKASGSWSATATWDCGCLPTTGNNVVIASPNNVTLAGNTTINNFTINNGGTLSDNGRALKVEGDLIINGVLAGTKATEAKGVGTNISGTGSISSTGGFKISKGSKTILSSTNLSITGGNATILDGITITNNGTISFDFDLNGNMGTPTWVNATNATLNVGGALFSTLGMLNSSASGNTPGHQDRWPSTYSPCRTPDGRWSPTACSCRCGENRPGSSCVLDAPLARNPPLCCGSGLPWAASR